MRQHVSALFLMLLSALFAPAIMAQGDVSILFNGVMPMDNIRIPGDKFGISQMEKDDFNHGVEVRFQDTKRFSFGVGWNRFNSYQKPPLELGWEIAESRAYMSEKHVMVLGGKVPHQYLARIVEQDSSSTDSLVGSVYYNCLKKGKLRPFIGVGFGANFVKEIFNRSIHDVPEDQVELVRLMGIVPKEETTLRTRPAYKAVVGVNYYPHKNFVLSISAGYFNGPAMIPGVGVTF